MVLLVVVIGDALGVPYEFHGPTDIPPVDEIEYAPPAGFTPAHPGVPPGTWSDDGAQALCLLASLLHCGRLDVVDLGNRLVNWYEHGYLAVDDDVFDIGIQTGQALRAIRAGVPAHEAGPSGEMDNGNGSLMRVLPLALWHRGSDRELAEDAIAQSSVTHGHRRSGLCCAIYCLWARGLLLGEGDAWTQAVAKAKTLFSEDEAELLERIDIDRPPVGAGSGYVVDTLHSARLACQAPDYEGVVKSAIALGHDTDTTAAVAGGIAGVRHGLSGIPEHFRTSLRGSHLYGPLLEELLARRLG